MNTIGKILVGINLLFSVVVTAFVLMLFTTQAHYQKGYKDVLAQYVGEHKAHEATITQSNKTITKLNDDLVQVTKDKDASVAEAKAAKGEADDAKKLAAEEQKKRAASDSRNTQLDTQVKNLVVEVNKKDELLAGQLKTIGELEDKTKKASEQMVKYKIAADSALARNDQLVTQLEKVLKELGDLRNDRAVKSGTLVNNPPPDDVKGTIKAADAQSGLVTINLGSDSGLSKGNTLHVYRTSPRPTYVGVLRVVDVRPNEAVGKLTTSSRPGAIQVGDEVASKILDNH